MLSILTGSFLYGAPNRALFLYHSWCLHVSWIMAVYLPHGWNSKVSKNLVRVWPWGPLMPWYLHFISLMNTIRLEFTIIMNLLVFAKYCCWNDFFARNHYSFLNYQLLTFCYMKNLNIYVVIISSNYLFFCICYTCLGVIHGFAGHCQWAPRKIFCGWNCQRKGLYAVSKWNSLCMSGKHQRVHYWFMI